MRRGPIFRRYFEALFDGDPIALGITAFFLLVVVVVGLVALHFKRQHRREEEEKRRRWGIKDPKAKK
jgi:hypothetical protein